jgi:ligand-binding sensor domain-containing protein
MEIDLLRDDGPIHDVTSSVAYDDGVLWQGTYFGLSRYDGRRWKSYLAADTGFPGDFITHVSSRGGTVWIATDQGLGVFDGQTCVSYRRAEDGRCDVRVWRDGREVERRTLATAPPDDSLLWAQGGDSDVWIATGRGLSHGTADGNLKER